MRVRLVKPFFLVACKNIVLAFEVIEYSPSSRFNMPVMLKGINFHMNDNAFYV